jgi:hypothetical protein
MNKTNAKSKTARHANSGGQGTKPSAPVTVKEGSYLTRQVDRAYRLGEIECDNVKHFRVVTKVEDGSRKMNIVRKTRIKIIDQMMPGVTAKCACEMAACKESWSHQKTFGVPTSEYVAYGQYSKGVGTYSKSAPLRQVVVPRYVLDNAQVEILNSDFPQYYFVSPTGGMMHDHPISHTRANMGRYAILDGLPRGTPEAPCRYLDLHGNPGANIKYNSMNPGIVIETLVELVTPKDYLRRSHWPERMDGNEELYYECSIAALAQRHELTGRWKAYLGFHTGYYYSANDFGNLFEMCPRAKVMLTMHKFPTVEGVLSNGEQTWKKTDVDGTTFVDQFNVKGSGKYTHPDNAAWFTHSCAVINSEMAYTWDASMLCNETYLFQVVALPTSVALRDSNCLMNSNAPAPSGNRVSMVPTDTFVANGFVSYRANSKSNTETLSAGEAKFFDEMRLNICGKERSPDRLRDHIAKAKTLVQGVQKKYDLPVHRTMALASAAFYVDLEHDSTVLPTLMGEMRPQAKAMAALFAGEVPDVGLFDEFRRWWQSKKDQPFIRDPKINRTFAGKPEVPAKHQTGKPFTTTMSNDLTKECPTNSRACVAALLMKDLTDTFSDDESDAEEWKAPTLPIARPIGTVTLQKHPTLVVVEAQKQIA